MSLPTFSSSSTAEDVATGFADEIKGKNVLVTGTSLDGIGFETARVTAQLRLSEDEIKREVPTSNIPCLELDLSSLPAVREAVAEVLISRGIKVLIHNAAAAIVSFKLTVGKLENPIATDHVGPFLLTKLLTPKLLEGEQRTNEKLRVPPIGCTSFAGMSRTDSNVELGSACFVSFRRQKLLAAGPTSYVPRVIFVSSAAHAYANGKFDLITQPDAATYTPFDAYFQAKSANVLTAIELSKRSMGRINAYSLHPGGLFLTPTQSE
ncbi:hypothetical protein C8R47DRAFT_1083476 [Mycena vitilis]|nr:hypothetical protein C8R47DRAFT_1083476 [Mycena vitilis]